MNERTLITEAEFDALPDRSALPADPSEWRVAAVLASPTTAHAFFACARDPEFPDGVYGVMLCGCSEHRDANAANLGGVAQGTPATLALNEATVARDPDTGVYMMDRDRLIPEGVDLGAAVLGFTLRFAEVERRGRG